ncbi:hypothetical protein EAF00_011956 [Botryotinia globosa]|nr:hypothetical protein EAF00_011956 [Botryotinia globosa]
MPAFRNQHQVALSKQGFKLQMATNCLGPFLFTQYLLPCLKATAKESKPSDIRVVWTHSQLSELTAPKDGTIRSELDTPPKDQVKNYNNSKIGNWFLASELAKEVEDGKQWSVRCSWGRIHPGPREDLLLALEDSDEGGSGTAKKFWDWCEGKTAEYS